MAGKISALEESLILKPITMSGIETLGILDEIQALVSDHLQVVICSIKLFSIYSL